MKAVELWINYVSYSSPLFTKIRGCGKIKAMLSHEEIPGTVVLKKSENLGYVVAQGPRFPGGVGVVFQLLSLGGARIFTGTALSGTSMLWPLLIIFFTQVPF